jgi:transposase
MREKSTAPSSPSERLVKTIRRATRKQYSAEEKIRIVLDGLRGESSIAELCRREGSDACSDEQRGDGPSPWA